MEHYCGNCGHPVESADVACSRCRPAQPSGVGQTAAGVHEEAKEPIWTTGSTLGVVSALFLLEGTVPSWADEVYSRLALLSFGRIQPDEAASFTLSAATVVAAVLFGIWLNDRWSIVRQAGNYTPPGWLAVALCLVPLVSIPATLYFVATIRQRFSDTPGPLMISRIGVATWIWWTTYHLSALAAGINAANGSGWTATCILFGISCGALAYVTSEVRSSTLSKRLAQRLD